MNAFDLALLVLLALFVLLGLWKGLARILIGVGALVAAFVMAARFHDALSERLGWIDVSVEVRKLIAYMVLFLGTMLAGGVVAWISRRLLRAAMLSWADRLAGGALGLVAAMLVAALVILPVVAYAPFGERVLRDSALAPYVTVVADVARALVPEKLSEKYRQRVERLRRYWSDHWNGGESV